VVRVTVARLAIDRSTNTPVVFLREAVGTRGVGIWIGAPEANAIALVLQDQEPPRPMTHDLLRTVVEAAGCRVTRVTVTGVVDGTYLAEVELAHADGRTDHLDARPSDAIALALRTGADILAVESILSAEGATPGEAPEPLSAEALRQHLKRLGPEDFGRFVP
jgi:hypothetical protein